MSASLIFCCSEDNDLYRTAVASGLSVGRVPDQMEAVRSAEPGSALLVLADGYPNSLTAVAPGLYGEAAAKGLRLYVEYPSSIPGVEAGTPVDAVWERGVVCSEAFGSGLPKMRLLGLHCCKLLPVSEISTPWIAAARVAGFDTAIFGLPQVKYPILFEAGSPQVLVATTKLSNAITARYAPTAAWKTIWERILDVLQPGVSHTLQWRPNVHPSYQADEQLPPDHERQAMKKGTQWFLNSRLLLSKSRLEDALRLLHVSAETTDVPGAGYVRGDGSFGIQEGFCASIAHDGSQRQRVPLRSDCTAESAMALAVDWQVDGSEESRQVAANLFDYVFFTSGMHSGPLRGNPEHPAFGLVSWGIGNNAWERAFYGDDDARVILSAIVGSACLGTDKYDENILRALMANLRTTGAMGFRGERIDIPDLERNGWKVYADSTLVHPAPHFESYLWACNLWAFDKTGYEPFLQKARNAIRMTMECYPGGWKWANGIAQERARMLLCLAWLVRMDDTPEHRDWVRQMAKAILANQEPCGAIREELGGGVSWAGALSSNEAYGTGEASLIQNNGDPVADMLYTCNFALLGLHEAAAATGDAEIRSAEDQLAEFLCRIQVRSDSLTYLDGGWFRAFDYRQWDYWASSSDLGWGAWSIESGWTQAWITAILGIRAQGTCIWDMTRDIRIDRHMAKVQQDLAANDGGPWKGEPWENPA